MKRCREGLAGLVLFGVALAAPAAAQHRLLTLDDIYDPVARIGRDRTPARPGTITWLDDRHYVWPRAIPGSKDRFTLLSVDASTGSEAPIFDPAALEGALLRVPGAARDEASRLARQRTYEISAAHDALLVTMADDLFLWPLGADHVVRLSAAPGREENPTFSPNGQLIAYTRGGNLYVADRSGGERALTIDGSNDRLNGRLDWIYEEEVFGRGRGRGFWWSPDSTQVAFLQLDETSVPRFTIVDNVPLTQEIEEQRYPRPGEPNPAVRLGIVRAVGGGPTWIDTSRYGHDFLIVNVNWLPDGRRLELHVQNRVQTWLDLDLADPASGALKTLFRETTPAWVAENGNAGWLRDGSFVWPSERSGWNHLYHYRADGTIIGAVTSGEWEVDSFYGVDGETGWIYFSATERSPIGKDLYRVKADGSGFTRLSARAGTHAASFNPSWTYYVGTWSAVTIPPQVRLHRSDGTEVRVIDANPMPELAQFELATPEFLQVPTRDGFVMEAMILKPPSFDPARAYPVYQHTYAGPHAPQVRDAWGGATYLYHQLLAQHGIIVWICDNRTASGKGIRSAWPAYKRLGEIELQDIEDGVAWLKRQPWVDGARIGLNGWSYGGFMTTYALTHSTSFAMGIAGGSVTDWRQYDSIYTERYMLSPEDNPDGYARTSPQAAAASLSGRLLLVHGTRDDNVHVQNTLQLAYALQKAGKPFELMLYPRSRHGVTDARLAKHMRSMMFEFILKTLKPAAPSGRETAGARPADPASHQ